MTKGSSTAINSNTSLSCLVPPHVRRLEERTGERGVMDAQRTFTLADQHAFADCVADYNPIHVDPQQARKLIGGSCVVHGIHGLLWALEVLDDVHKRLAQCAALSVHFRRTITIGTQVTARLVSSSDKQQKIEIASIEGVCSTITLKFGTVANPNLAKPFSLTSRVPRLAEPVELELDEIVGVEGRIAFGQTLETAIELAFPKLARILSVACVSDIAVTSTVVGMHVPGLHSLYSELSITFAPSPDPVDGLSFRATQFDERFRLVIVDLSARAFRGIVTAFVRFPAMVPPKAAEIALRIGRNTFSGRNALVVGGSRGIGAVTAKIIAAGGGLVTVTYLDGAAQAEEVVADIVATFGDGSAEILRFDAAAEALSLHPDVLASFDSIYYFATPKISAGSDKGYSSSMFEGFLSIYVTGFWRLFDGFRTARKERGGYIFYPSTIYLEERPKGMTEYAMAKAAGEVLCADIAKNYPNWEIAIPRLPRIATDQTLTVPPIKSEDPLDAMIRVLDVSA